MLNMVRRRLYKFPETKVVNFYHLGPEWQTDPSFVYIGRPDSRIDTDVPGGTGFFGNPFRSGSREENIERFKEYFDHQVGVDSQFRFMVSWLRGKNLVCWCSPQPCHGDVIKRYLDERT